MGSLDARVLTAARKAFARINVTGTLRSFPSRAYSSTTGDITPGLPTDTTVASTPAFAYSRRLVDGDLIRDGDCWCLIKAEELAVVPTQGVLYTLSGVQWDIVSTKQHSGGDAVAVYELQLRRAG